MKTDVIAYTMGAQFAAYVANGDASHLTDQEVGDFDMIDQQAHDQAPAGFHFGHWAIEIDDRNEFARCEATDLMGDCYRFDAVYFETNQTAGA
jgi:hypothetical protein